MTKQSNLKQNKTQKTTAVSTSKQTFFSLDGKKNSSTKPFGLLFTEPMTSPSANTRNKSPATVTATVTATAGGPGGPDVGADVSID